jgi:hypothetical protein
LIRNRKTRTTEIIAAHVFRDHWKFHQRLWNTARVGIGTTTRALLDVCATLGCIFYRSTRRNPNETKRDDFLIIAHGVENGARTVEAVKSNRVPQILLCYRSRVPKLRRHRCRKFKLTVYLYICLSAPVKIVCFPMSFYMVLLLCFVILCLCPTEFREEYQQERKYVDVPSEKINLILRENFYNC